MTKIAFCFPGQGSIEAGMGRDIAEAVPEALSIYRRGSIASGLDLERLCFHAEAADLVERTRQRALHAAGSRRRSGIAVMFDRQSSASRRSWSGPPG